LLDIGEIKHIENGFFDMQIKYAGKMLDRYERKSYFPLGTSVEDTVSMIEKAIENIEKIENVTGKGRIDKVIYQIELYNNQAFHLCVKNNTATFYPFVKKGL